VAKDALHPNMNNETNAKRIAAINAAIAEGVADIKAGRVTTYSPRLIDQLTDKVYATMTLLNTSAILIL